MVMRILLACVLLSGCTFPVLEAPPVSDIDRVHVSPAVWAAYERRLENEDRRPQEISRRDPVYCHDNTLWHGDGSCYRVPEYEKSH